MMRRIWGGALVATLLAVTGAAAVPTASRVQGHVEYRAPRAADWTALAAGTELPEGTRIQTSLGGRLEIALDDGSKTTLRENSIFEVVRAAGGRHEFRLWIGGLRNVVRPLSPGGTFEVRTPIATAGVRGTDYDMGVGEDGTTGLRVFDGTVWLRSDVSDQEVVVPAGSGSTAGPDGSVSAAAAHGQETPDDDVRATASTTSTSSAPVEIRIESPLDGATVGAGSLAVVGTAAPGARLRVGTRDVVCDVAGRFSTTVDVQDGPNVIAVATEDGLSQAQVTVLVDAAVPAIRTNVLSGLVTNQPALSLTVTTTPGATVTAGGQTAAAEGGVANLTLTLVEGENLIEIEAAAPNGKRATTTLYAVLDTLAPQITVIAVQNVTGGVRVAGLTEAGASVTASGYPVDVRADGSFDDVLSGLVSPVTLEARDQAGNLTRDLRSVEGSVDVSPPSLVSLSFSPTTVEAGASATATLVVADASDVQPTLVLSLTGSGGATLSGTLAAGGTTYTGTILVPSSTAAGTYAADRVTVADVLGNAATLAPAASLVVVNNAPTATASASDGTVGGKVTISWGSTAADVASYVVRESPGGVVYSGPSAGSQILTGRNNSAYSYEVTATDLAGNVSLPATAGVTITDADRPSVPGGLSVNSSSAPLYRVTWSASSDASTAPGAAVTYEVYVDGSGPFQTSNTSFDISVTGGSKTVQVYAKDSAGNVSANPGAVTVP